MRFTPCLPVILIAPLLLSACAGTQTSVNKHARHMAYQLANSHFDPNTRPLTTDNARRMAGFLNQFYMLGKKDRAEGLTVAQAQQRVNSFNRDDAGAPFAQAAQKDRFITHQYSAEQPENRVRILREGATATYWDGYHGKP